jgi:AcrR family transcriptional regulator
MQAVAYHHGDLRAALVRAAFALARRDGPEGVTLRAVAKRAKVSEAAPYHHFKDKRALLAAAAGVGFEQLDALVGDAETDDPAEAVSRFAASYVGFAIEEPGAFRLMFGAHVAELDLGAIPELAVPARRLKVRMRALAARCAPHDAETLFQMVWAQCHGIAWLVVEKELDPAGAEATSARNAIAIACDAVSRLIASVRKC